MGKILKCWDTNLKRTVVLKLLKDLSSAKAAKRFQDEARATARLNHPNVVNVLDFGQTESGDLYLVMDYLNGVDLSEFIETRNCIDPRQAIDLVLQLCAGLHHAHSHNVLHRDVKPSNVMIVNDREADHSVVLLDFGIAKARSNDEKDITRRSVAVGSPPYMSPESIKGIGFDRRSDIYSLGCLVFHCIAGSPPFLEDTPLATMMKHTNEMPPTMETVAGKEIPDKLQQIVSKCLAKSPDQRYQSVENLSSDLQAAAASIGVTHDDETITDLTREPSQRNRDLTIFFGIATGALLVIGASYFFHKQELEQASTGSTRMKVIGEDLPLHVDKIPGSVDMKALSDQHDYVQFFGVEAETPLDTVLKYRRKKSFDLVSQNNVAFTECTVSQDQARYLARFPIKRLAFRRTEIGNDSMEILASIQTLENLYIDHSWSFDKRGLSSFKQSGNLTGLTLRKLQVADDIVDSVIQLRRLERLSFRHSMKITGKGFEKLATLPQLERLDLAGSGFEPQNLPVLSNLKSLKYLDLADIDMTDSDLEQLADISARTVVVDLNPITDKGIIKLASCKNLGALIVRNCNSITKYGLTRLKKKRPQLTIDSNLLSNK